MGCREWGWGLGVGGAVIIVSSQLRRVGSDVIAIMSFHVFVVVGVE